MIPIDVGWHCNKLCVFPAWTPQMGNQLQVLYPLEEIDDIGRPSGKKSTNTRNKTEVQKKLSTQVIVARIRINREKYFKNFFNIHFVDA